MKHQYVPMALVVLITSGSVNVIRADTIRSFESISPLWACAMECGKVTDDEIGACLEACGRDDDATTARTAADQLRCKASLMRAEAAQFSCHSRCLADGDTPGADIVGCVDACNSRYQARTALILRTTRCASMLDQ